MESIRYFEDFEIGKDFISKSRTVTEADIVNFACLTGDFHPIHTDAEFSKTSFFGERVAHGLLSLSFTMGMINDWEYRSKTMMAFLKVTCNFLKPVKINDTIHGKVTILNKKAWKNPDKGVLVFGLEVINQKGDIIAQGELEELVFKKNKI